MFMASIFTKIIERELPSTIEYEDDEIIVIHDINPRAPIHLLIIPKEEIPTVNDFTKDHAPLMAKMIFIAQDMAKKLDLEGYKLEYHVGEKGGQIIFHVHLHLLGYKNS